MLLSFGKREQPPTQTDADHGTVHDNVHDGWTVVVNMAVSIGTVVGNNNITNY